MVFWVSTIGGPSGLCTPGLGKGKNKAVVAWLGSESIWTLGFDGQGSQQVVNHQLLGPPTYSYFTVFGNVLRQSDSLPGKLLGGSRDLNK